MQQSTSHEFKERRQLLYIRYATHRVSTLSLCHSIECRPHQLLTHLTSLCLNSSELSCDYPTLFSESLISVLWQVNSNVIYPVSGKVSAFTPSQSKGSSPDLHRGSIQARQIQ